MVIWEALTLILLWILLALFGLSRKRKKDDNLWSLDTNRDTNKQENWQINRKKAILFLKLKE